MSVISDSNASGGKSAGKFESDSSYCQISITVPADAVYDIVIRSKAIGHTKRMTFMQTVKSRHFRKQTG